MSKLTLELETLHVIFNSLVIFAGLSFIKFTYRLYMPLMATHVEILYMF